MYSLCILVFSLFSACCSIIVESPPGYEGHYHSSLIYFGDQSRLDFDFISGELEVIYPGISCTIEKKNMESLVALVEEKVGIEMCKKMEILYQQIQLSNFSAILVGTRTLSTPGKSIGYPYGMDISFFSIPVTFVSKKEYTKLLDASTIGPIKVTIDNDLGPFYRLSVNPGFKVYQYGASIIYLLLFFYSIFLIAYETYKHKLKRLSLLTVIFCIHCLCLVRGIKVATYEHKEFYMSTPHSREFEALMGPVFWFPISLGTTAYTLAAFACISTVSLIEPNDIINRIKKPLLIFFVSLIPFSIILPAINAFYPVYSFFFMCFSIVIVGLFETVVLSIYGVKIIRHLSYASSLLKTKKSDLERKLTIFIMGTVVSWIGIVVISLLFFLLGMTSQSEPSSLLTLSICRDLMISTLCGLLLLVVTKKEEKENSLSLPSSQKKDVKSLTASVITISETRD